MSRIRAVQLAVSPHFVSKDQNSNKYILFKLICIIHTPSSHYTHRQRQQTSAASGIHLLLACWSLLTWCITASGLSQLMLYHNSTAPELSINYQPFFWERAVTQLTCYFYLVPLWYSAFHYWLYHLESSLRSYQQHFLVLNHAPYRKWTLLNEQFFIASSIHQSWLTHSLPVDRITEWAGLKGISKSHSLPTPLQ